MSKPANISDLGLSIDVHLCRSCINQFKGCESFQYVYGTGLGSGASLPNICACDGYDASIAPRASAVRAGNLEPRAGNLEHGSNNLEHGSNNLEHGTSNLERRAGDLEHRAKILEHKAGSLERRAQDLKRRTEASDHSLGDENV